MLLRVWVQDRRILVEEGAVRALPAALHDHIDDDHKLALPMADGNRSLNLSNAVSIVLYEAWRRCDFAGMVPLSANPDLV